MKQKATPSREPSAAELREVLLPLDATLEQLARVLMNTPPKKRVMQINVSGGWRALWPSPQPLSRRAQDTTLLPGHDLLPPFFGLRVRVSRAPRPPDQRKNANCRVVSSRRERGFFPALSHWERVARRAG